MTTVYCTACGSSLATSDAFCRACGAAQRDPDSQPTAYGAGVEALQQGRRALAVDLLTQAAAETPDCAQAWLALGTGCRQADQLEAAEAHLRRSLALAESGVGWAQLGLVLLGRYAIDDAREALDRAVVLAPDEFSVRGCRAEYFWRLGFWLDALTELEAAVACAPDAASLTQARRVLTEARQKAAGSFRRGAVLPPVGAWAARLLRAVRRAPAERGHSRGAATAPDGWARESP